MYTLLIVEQMHTGKVTDRTVDTHNSSEINRHIHLQVIGRETSWSRVSIVLMKY